MCTYEDLVDATLPHGLIPLVVPQLRTITLGGAVTGLGIESTSFRSGLPHESVLELDILTGAGEVVTARPDNEHADLFAAFPNSFGSLGYATRLRIALEPVRSHVALRHLRFDDAEQLAKTLAAVVETGEHDGDPRRRARRRLVRAGRALPDPGAAGRTRARRRRATTPVRRSTSARSSSARPTCSPTYDYLWRWDTDWFWCSQRLRAGQPAGAPAVAAPLAALGRLPPAASPSTGASASPTASTGGPGRPERERVIQDVEVPVEQLPAFLAWFDARGRDATGVAVPGA